MSSGVERASMMKKIEKDMFFSFFFLLFVLQIQSACHVKKDQKLEHLGIGILKWV